MSLVDQVDNSAPLAHPEPTSFRGLLSEEPPPLVELCDLYKELGGHPVLAGVSLSIRKGETMCIIGGSGAGKSVTLKHIVGLLQPDRGCVKVDGENVTEGGRKVLDEIRKKVGYCFQGAALLNSLNVFENVALPVREHENFKDGELRDRVLAKLELVGLGKAVQKMPAQLSGGMKKRVGLARAIVRDPEIILYDEPTAGLDPIIASSINSLILDMQAKLQVTSILVTHDMSSAFRVSNRIAMLHEGKIIRVGTIDELKECDDERVQQFIYGDSEGPLTRERA